MEDKMWMINYRR